jgi:hypothetical protein
MLNAEFSVHHSPFSVSLAAFLPRIEKVVAGAKRLVKY